MALKESACDRYGKWYASKVLEILENRSVRVHFLGWKESYDEIICASQVAKCIAPLYSNTVNRRNWRIGDIIEHQCAPDCSTHNYWLQCTIVNTNPSENAVPVQLSSTRIERFLKKLRMSIASTVLDDSKWYDLLSDSIAPLTTHTRVTKRSCQEITSDALSQSGSWLTTRLCARYVSDAHIQRCEDALVWDEGFTSATLFAALPKEIVAEYLTKIGITAKGVQMQLVAIHEELNAT